MNACGTEPVALFVQATDSLGPGIGPRSALKPGFPWTHTIPPVGIMILAMLSEVVSCPHVPLLLQRKDCPLLLKSFTHGMIETYSACRKYS
jgi:hypothetical protein